MTNENDKIVLLERKVMKIFKKIMFIITLPIAFVLGISIFILMYILLPFDYFGDFTIINAIQGNQ